MKEIEDPVFEGLQSYLVHVRLFVVGEPILFVLVVGLSIGLYSVAGEVITYWAARLGGRPLLERMGARGWLRMDEGRIQRTEELFSRWGVHLVMFGRILPGVRTLVSVPAGLSRMNFSLFLAAAFAGAAIWNVFLVGVGYLLGFHVFPLSPFLLG